MSVRWWGDKREWGIICGTREIKIKSVKIFNGCGKEASKMKVGSRLIVKVEFDVQEEVEEPHFGVAIFRDDGVYCYGPNTSFEGYKIEKLSKGRGWFSIEYNQILLMPGEYYLSVGIWDKKEILPYSFHICRYSFKVEGINRTKQLLFLPYQWNSDQIVDSFTARTSNPSNLSFLIKRRQQKFNNENFNVDIDSIRLLDSMGNIRDSFNTNELMKIRIEIKSEELSNCLIWLGLYRIDDIYCHGVFRNITEYENVFFLSYPKLHLLPGEYYLSLGIWKKKHRKPLMFKHKASLFKVFYLSQDHGTVYLEHSWKWASNNNNDYQEIKDEK